MAHRQAQIANRAAVLGALVDAGAELIVSGHVHQSAISERHEFEVVEGDVPGTTVVTARGSASPAPSAAAKRAACTSSRPTRAR